VNLKRTKPLEKWALWRHRGLRPLRLEPVRRFGLELMSVGFLLAEDQPLAWPGQMVEFVGRQLVHDVAWSELDYLIVDLPPGTADVQQQLLRLLPLAGAVIVVSPQDVAHLDAKKVVSMLRDAGVPVLGAVENMSGFACPHCGERVEVFPHGPEERSLWALGVPLLGAIPLDPALARAGDRGRPLLAEDPDGPHAQAFRRLAASVAAALEGLDAAAVP
jgi:ATP-binding protein involved in chromosome partitioning